MSNATEITKNIIKKIPAGIGGVIVIILIVVAVMTSWFTVDPQEEAVVLRFGKITSPTRTQGLNFKMLSFSR